MDQIGKYFFDFFAYVENGWNYLNSEVITKYDYKYKKSVIDQLKNFEVRMKQYNPIAIIICTFILFYVFFWILRLIRKTWRKISK